MGLADNFIGYLYEKGRNIPETVLDRAKDCLFDYLSVTCAGAHVNAGRWRKYLSLEPKGKAGIIGTGMSCDGKTAAFVNGFNAHCIELDDGHRFAMIHPGAPVISALLSAMAECGFSREEVLKGIVIGYEAACRLAVSMQPSHKINGFHATGTCGTVGAAVGTAFALGMSEKQAETVLASAAASASGLLELQKQSSELKPYNAGKAAMDGLNAAYMGFTGFIPPDDILNGDRGFMKLFCSGADSEKLIARQDYFEIERIYVKPYAACRHCHPAIEAALTLRERVYQQDIESIYIDTYQLAVKMHDHTTVGSVSSAKLSIPYSVAAAFVLGNAGISAFSSEHLTDSRILSLMQKIKVAADDEFTRQSPGKRIAEVTVRMIDGTCISHRVDYAKGDPENPMSRDDLICKARELNPCTYTEFLKYAYSC